MRLILQQFVSLDGVTQGPGAPDEDTSNSFDRGGWFVPYLDPTSLAAITAWISGADAFLFGRRTYEAFAIAWPKATDPDDTVAAALNGLPKYVASDSLTTTTWGPATILSGDVAAQVASLKQQPGRELQIHGSTTLGRALLNAGLVDELRLAVAPVVVGTGRRLLTEGPATGFHLRSNDTTPGGLALQVYEAAGPARFGTYGS